MKLRNLMYATMIACAFASCSKDEDGIDNGGGQGNADGSTTLSVKVADKLKASDDEISELNVLIFGAEGLQVVDASGTEKKDIPVTAGTKTIVLVANAADQLATLSSESTLDDLKAITCNYGEVDGELTMSSKAYTVTIQAGQHHYLGYTSEQAAAGVNLNEATMGDNAIPMFRNVAKVTLNSVKLDVKPQYGEDATFQLEEVFVLHAKKTSNLVPSNLTEYWATTEVTAIPTWIIGSTADEYAEWVNTMENAPASVVPFKNYIPSDATTAPEAAVANYYTQAIANMTLANKAVTADNSFNSYYVYENTESADYQTLLVVKGKLLYGGLLDAPSTYYPVGVGQDVKAGSSLTIPSLSLGDMEFTRSETAGVLRNLNYIISLTIKGPGKTTPFGPDPEDFTFLDVQVQVVPFGAVYQDVEI